MSYSIYLIMASVCCALLALFVGLPTIVLRPAKFVVFMSLSTLCAIGSVIAMQKPQEFFAMFCVLGSSRLDVNHKAKAAINSKKVSFASKEEAEDVTLQIYGGISPLGLPVDIEIFVDKKVLNREKVFIGAGNRVSKFFLSPKTLVKLTNATVLDLT